MFYVIYKLQATDKFSLKYKSLAVKMYIQVTNYFFFMYTFYKFIFINVLYIFNVKKNKINKYIKYTISDSNLMFLSLII